jgi:hypothetical protein
MIWQAVTSITQSIGVVATVEIRTANSYSDNRFALLLSGCLRSITVMKQDLIPVHYSNYHF